MAELTVHVWSDVACPWCFVGKRQLERAIERLPAGHDVSVEWHAFELNPAAPERVDTSIPYAARLAQKYMTSEAQAQMMIDRMVGVGAEVGIDFDFDHVQPSNTFDAHRLIQLAKERGLGDAMKERLFRAYLCEGARMSDRATLVELAGDVGIDADGAAAAWAMEGYGDDVRRDELAARELGVSGVPFFVIGGYGIPGAQKSEVLGHVLERAFDDLGKQPEIEEGMACGPDGC